MQKEKLISAAVAKKPRRRGLVFQLYIRKYNNIRRIIHFYSPYLN